MEIGLTQNTEVGLQGCVFVQLGIISGNASEMTPTVDKFKRYMAAMKSKSCSCIGNTIYI